MKTDKKTDAEAQLKGEELLAATRAAKKKRKKKAARSKSARTRKKNRDKTEAKREHTRQEKAKIELVRRELCRRHLLPFVQRYEPMYLSGWVHKRICEELMQFLADVVAGLSPRLMITMPPRHGKSMLASQYFPAWALGKYPHLEFINTSYAQSLQMDFSRKIQELIKTPDFALLFGSLGITKKNEAIERWSLYDFAADRRTGGGVLAAGVGGPITGRGAHVFLIDDPVKNREEAESQVVREGAKSWYSSTAYTRLAPGAGILVIQCMTGDTPVLMANGTECPLRQIRVGDKVATYDSGILATSYVKNWINQGPDAIYEITTKSGKLVRANERHPFLVDNDGEPKWIRTKDLNTTQSLYRARKESGRVKSVWSKRVASQSCAEGTAHHTTTKRSGPTGGGHRQSTLARVARRIYDTATGLVWKSLSACFLNRAVFVPSVRSYPQSITLKGNLYSASTTVTSRGKSEASYVITAMWQSGMQALWRIWNPQLNISDFILDPIVGIIKTGKEDVFDIQVERTENFIANGLVASNTRWHDDDLSGWLLEKMREAEKEMKEDPDHEWPEDADRWRTVDFPAIATSDEKYRLRGDPLHPERYDLKTLRKIKRTLAPRDWSALYQQNPQVEEGAYFQKKYIRTYTGAPPYLDIFCAGDLAISKKEHADWTVFYVAGLDVDGKIYILEEYRGRWDAGEIINVMFEIHRKWKPKHFGLEKGQISLTMDAFLRRRIAEEKLYDLYVQELPPGKQDKELRARSFQGLMSLGMVYWPEGALWVDDAINELLRFPSGVKDDRVDAAAWIGKMIASATYVGEGRPKKPTKSWKTKLAGYVKGNKGSDKAMAA